MLRIAAGLLLAGSLGLLALFGGIAIGAALGIDEPTGIIGMVPIASGVMAMVGISAGLLLLGIGMLRRRLFPWWARSVPPLMALVTPVAMMAIGAADGALESVVFVAWLSSFGLGLAALGYAMSEGWQRGENLSTQAG